MLGESVTSRRDLDQPVGEVEVIDLTRVTAHCPPVSVSPPLGDAMFFIIICAANESRRTDVICSDYLLVSCERRCLT